MVSIALNALGGLHLNVERTGNGPPILAIHGFTGNITTWEDFSRAARSNFSVITADILGHGSSDAPDNPEPYSMESTLKALAELLDILSIQRVHWLGYSMGGRIALAAAVHLKERTLSVTAESASPGLPTLDERAARVHNDEMLADKIETEGIAAFVDHWESLPLWASQARQAEDFRRKLRLQRLAGSPTGLANSLRGIGAGAQPPFHDLLHGLQVPALFIAGAEDDKYVSISQEMQRIVAGSQLRIVPECGHAVHLEEPARFNQIVLDFLRKVGDSDTRVVQTRSRRNP